MKRRVVMNMNKTTSKGKVVRQCTREINSKLSENVCSKVKKDKVLNPTLKCHEEVMSRLSQCTPNCYNGIDNYSAKTESRPSSRTKTKHDHRRIMHSQPSETRKKVVSGLDFEAVIKPNRDKEPHSPKSLRSKSVPNIHKSKLEDYVDYIPVKLYSKEATKENQNLPNTQKSTHNLNSERQKKSRTFRPTWDTLLKGESKEKLHSAQAKISSNHFANHDKNSVTDGSSSDWPVYKNPSTISNLKNDNALGNGDAGNLNTITHKNGTDAVVFRNFYGVEPVKTLDFLIKHLREKLCKQRK